MKISIVLLCSGLTASIGFAESGTLILEQALELARQSSPELRAAQMVAQSAVKGVDASGLWENPKLEFEAEGLGWDNDLFSDGEYTLGLKQEFQRGGKRAKERAIALQSIGVADFVAQEKKLDLDTRVRVAFIELMVQQETGKVRAEQEQLGRAFIEVAKRRHQAGGGSELDVVQAELALEEIILLQTCCFGDLLAAKERLASLIGIPVLELGELSADFYALNPVEGLSVGSEYPSLRRLDAEVDKIRAEAQYAKAQDVSNVSLTGGYRYEAAGDINTFVFSASMPLSFNKRGQAEYAANMLRANAVQAEREDVLRRLQMELDTHRALYNGAEKQVELTITKLLPKAEQAYELSREGYDIGRFSWIELIAAHQNLADIRIRYIESLREAHLAYAQISKFSEEGI